MFSFFENGLMIGQSLCSLDGLQHQLITLLLWHIPSPDYPLFGRLGTADGNKGSANKTSLKIGTLSLIIQQGDITKETTDAIANGTNESLDLTSGILVLYTFVCLCLSANSPKLNRLFVLVMRRPGTITWRLSVHNWSVYTHFLCNKSG